VTGLGDAVLRDGIPPTAALSLWFIATSPTPEHAARHEDLARERGTTDLVIAHARRLMRQHQAERVHTIHGGSQ
jgi:hypothetical protein